MLRWFSASILLMLSALSANAIQAVVSHSIFYMPTGDTSFNATPYIEAYWQIDPRTLNYTQNQQNTWTAKIKTAIVFRNNGSIIKTDAYILETQPAGSLEAAPMQTVLDLRRYSMPAGHIEMELTLTDMADSSHPYHFTDTFSVIPAQRSAFYSDIQLLDTTYPNAMQTIFQKNNQQQIPLCANFYDTTRNILHFYGELYNADALPKEQYPLTQEIYISKKTEEGPILNLTQKDTIAYKRVQPIIGSFVINQIPSGNYYVNLKLTDKNNVIIATKAFLFQRYNEIKAVAEKELSSSNFDTGFQKLNILDLRRSFVSKYNLPQLKAILKMILPVANPAEAQAIHAFTKTPDENYIRYFIYNHFSAINKNDPNKAWEEYANKIREVNKLFSTPSATGYESDRGYVYLRYGKPDEDITVVSERGSLPYEIWQYNNINHKYSNVIFLFYRPDEMTSDYRLLHSTIPGEVHNPSWRSYLYVNGTTINENSRAEQYIGNR